MMKEQQVNPSGDEIETATWVWDVVSSWEYPDADCQWFVERLRKVPAEAGVAGGFATHLFDLLRLQGHNVEDCLAWLRYEALPNKFRPMPLNHFLLTAAEIAHRLGGQERLYLDAPSIQDGVHKAMCAALIRMTLPGLAGGDRVVELLRLLAKAFSGVLFSHARLSVVEDPRGWMLQHRNEHNFLAHFHYAEAYRRLLEDSLAPVEEVRFEWVGPAAADVLFVLPT